MRNTPELNEQIRFFAILELNKIPELAAIHASMNGVWSASARTAALRAQSGQKAGIPDIFVPIPSGGFHGAYIELKVKPNKCTGAQTAFLEFAASQGYATKVAWSADEALLFLEEYLDVKLKYWR